MPVGFGLGRVGGVVRVGAVVALGPKGVVRGPQFGGGVQRGAEGSSSSGWSLGFGVGVGLGFPPAFCWAGWYGVPPGRGVCCGDAGLDPGRGFAG